MCMEGWTDYAKAKKRSPMDVGNDGAWIYHNSTDCAVSMPSS